MADPLESIDRHHLLSPIAEASTPGVIWDGPAVIATDGSVSHHNGHAGWGWISNRGAFGLGALGSTHDVCHSELSGVRDALARVRDGRQVEVLVDSTEAISLIDRYIREGDSSVFVSRRRRAALRGLDRTPVREVTISKVAGHSGHPLNEGADRLSKLARRASEGGLEPATVWKQACGIRDDVMAAL
ncbi:RNase H family protein [Leucobacter sp. cx-169]|uniref:RNase H family protein n=1 Tax=Leucobacter sp. cx-169 TaxID=2770549 RepID=UPI00165E9BE3|nr:RNase H family protein [Leucobacter sp. cx-169]MBC9927331.1 hypothetical protein [Leucobacter sp. cx-169]